MKCSMPARAVKAALVLLAVLVLSGCVNAPSSRPFNADANRHIETIAVLPMRENALNVMIVNNPGYSFGLIGAAVAEAHMAPRRAWLRDQVEAESFDHIAFFRAAFDEAMRERGYTLLWPDPVIHEGPVRVRREVNGLRREYAPTDPGAQAQLDINFGFTGYAAAGSGAGAPYRPTAVLVARMLGADGTQELFFEQFLYNEVFPMQSGGITIPPEPHYVYPNFDALKEADAEAVEGLRQAFTALAQEVARQFQARQ